MLVTKTHKKTKKLSFARLKINVKKFVDVKNLLIFVPSLTNKTKKNEI